MVDEKGQIIEVFGGDEEVKKEVINTISRIKDKWIPTTVRRYQLNLNINSQLRLALKQSLSDKRNHILIDINY
jgi:hypothetical protein